MLILRHFYVQESTSNNIIGSSLVFHNDLAQGMSSGWGFTLGIIVVNHDYEYHRYSCDNLGKT